MQFSPFLRFAGLPIAAWFGVRMISTAFPNRRRNSVRIVVLFLAAVSTLFLILSLPTGSVDVSDFWRFLGSAVLAAIPLLGLTGGKRILTSWIRLLVRTTTLLILIPTGGLFLVLCLAEAGGTRRAVPLLSPDGKHVALQEILVGSAVDSDQGTVSVRDTWWPFATVVYDGEGGCDLRSRQPNYPTVRWLKDSTLLIRYSQIQDDLRGDNAAMCKQPRGSVHVICEKTAEPLRSPQ